MKESTIQSWSNQESVLGLRFSNQHTPSSLTQAASGNGGSDAHASIS